MAERVYSPSLLDDVDPDLHVLSPVNCMSYDGTEYPQIPSCRNTPSFSIFHVNVRSFNRNSSELLNCLSVLDTELSIIALSETWLNDSNESTLSAV